MNVYRKKNSSNKDITPSDSKDKMYFKILFYGENTFKVCKSLTNLINCYFPQTKLCIVFKNKFPICKLFKFKDKIDKPLVSILVYKHECNRCNSIHISD